SRIGPANGWPASSGGTWRRPVPASRMSVGGTSWSSAAATPRGVAAVPDEVRAGRWRRPADTTQVNPHLSSGRRLHAGAPRTAPPGQSGRAVRRQPPPPGRAGQPPARRCGRLPRGVPAPRAAPPARTPPAAPPRPPPPRPRPVPLDRDAPAENRVTLRPRLVLAPQHDAGAQALNPGP